jgi:serine/threonine-protein phosphatase 2A regulatory subunit B
MSALQRNEWKFTQVFGDRIVAERVTDEDVINALAFDKTGRYLALGDKAGRLIVFDRSNSKKSKKGHSEFTYMTELQSHVKEFDFLKSVDIEEKINDIEWLRPEGENMFMLTTNDKTIKLWKLSNKSIKKSEKLGDRSGITEKNLALPKLKLIDKGYCPSLKRAFSNLHNFHINSISVSANGENFISSDDLRINFWNLETPHITYNLIDLKPESFDDISEVITKARFHPETDYQFLYSTSKGIISIGDMRINSNVSKNLLVLEDKTSTQKKNFFTDIINSISDLTFSANGKYIYSRDFLTVKVWDVANTSKPLQIMNIFEPLKSKLCGLYEKDCIFDKFSISASPCSDYVVTGMFNNRFHIMDRKGEKNTQFELNFNRKTISKVIPQNFYESLSNDFNYSKKVLKVAWNPESDCVAVASANCLFFYNA